MIARLYRPLVIGLFPIALVACMNPGPTVAEEGATVPLGVDLGGSGPVAAAAPARRPYRPCAQHRSEMQMAHAGHNDAHGTGTVNSVDPAQHKVNLSHSPIPEIGWPAMTMDFPVAPSVDLKRDQARHAREFHDRERQGRHVRDPGDCAGGRGPMTPPPPSCRSALTRRRFMQGAAAAGALVACAAGLCDGARAAAGAGSQRHRVSARDRRRAAHHQRPARHRRPASTARCRRRSCAGAKATRVTLAVTNRLSEPSSIHWHGIRTPSPMDGVPGLSFRGIAPGETFVYRFPVHQSGTYWYHSHSMFQEQTGLYGAIVIEPRGGYAQAFDRDYVVLLSDWSDENPETIVSNLKFQSDYYNYGQRTLGTFIDDAQRKGLAATVADRLEWGKMRMSPTDILDVSGATYTYLINGQAPAANWTALFRPGERVRLRFINGSSMSIFDVRIRRPADDGRPGRRQRCRSRSRSMSSASASPRPMT